MDVIDGLDRTQESFLDAVVKGAFTVPGDGSLDFEAIVKRLAGYGYEGWFVVEAEQDPKKAPPLKMAKIGHKELLRVMTAAGYTVVAGERSWLRSDIGLIGTGFMGKAHAYAYRAAPAVFPDIPRVAPARRGGCGRGCGGPLCHAIWLRDLDRRLARVCSTTRQSTSSRSPRPTSCTRTWRSPRPGPASMFIARSRWRPALARRAR